MVDTVTRRTNEVRYTSHYLDSYDVESSDMRRLYENAKRDQWNASKDIDWDQPLDPDQGILNMDLVDVKHTKYWDKLSPKQRVEMNELFSAWRISQLLHGEQGAVLVCSHIADTVDSIDSKFFMATQVMDEARHTEVLSRYLAKRIPRYYPMGEGQRQLFDTLLTESKWYIKTIGLQLVGETFAVSLFRLLGESSPDPLFRQVCRNILRDESRHMGFGMIGLPGVVAELEPHELRELEDFTVQALYWTLRGGFTREAYEDMGFSKQEIEDIQQTRAQAAAGETILFRRMFKKEMHQQVVNNLVRVGLLTERVAPRLADLGIKLEDHLEKARGLTARDAVDEAIAA
ncbi:MAG TPA: ferritin-like domain-containing protein, partial [Dehalococcoidia bacterium]|nr:ferritin-like domain-containing protein [Dehalococcoidia bacterium]